MVVLKRTFFWILLMTLICAGFMMAQQAQYAREGPALMPDLTVTKGQVVILTKGGVCGKRWGKDEQHVTAAMKDQVYSEYGTAPDKGVCVLKTHTGTQGQRVKEGCEVGHLIRRELGGADAVDNLWPQPYTQHPGAHEKDWLENELHREVCAGTKPQGCSTRDSE
jgi:hypothetical protein